MTRSVEEQMAGIIQKERKRCREQEVGPAVEAVRRCLSIAEDRTPGTWDDVMFCCRKALAAVEKKRKELP